VRFGPFAKSLATSKVHLSPIICSAPAIGHPSILRRLTSLFNYGDITAGGVVTTVFDRLVVLV